MTDGQTILRDIEFSPPHKETIPKVIRVLFVHNMLYFILHLRVGFSGYDEHQDVTLGCTQLPIYIEAKSLILCQATTDDNNENNEKNDLIFSLSFFFLQKYCL